MNTRDDDFDVDYNDYLDDNSNDDNYEYSSEEESESSDGDMSDNWFFDWIWCNVRKNSDRMR